MTDPQFNELVHSPVRLRICALLRPANQLEFATIRDTLEISDTHLSKNLKLLSDAGIVQLRKDQRTANARMRTWVALTSEGSAIVDGHLAALAQIAGGSL